MKSLLKPGKYVIAVSGGVDSVVLLNMLSMQGDIDLVVAHFDHGIRENSDRDAKFVEQLAQSYNLPFECAKGQLGLQASEALARQKRYDFLELVREKHHALAIVTAHHEDDVLETALINLIRGTKRKGLTSLESNTKVIRPLLNLSKEEIINYANSHSLRWYEDETNTDEKYLRNLLRKKIANLPQKDKSALQEIISGTKPINDEIDHLISGIIDNAVKEDILDRKLFLALPYDVSSEVLAHWFRTKHVEINSKRIHQLVQQLKTANPSTEMDIDKHWILKIEKDQIRMQPRS